MFFITIPVILYQLFFIVLLVVGGLVGRKTLLVLAALSLIWTTTHLFFLPLAIFQGLVIAGTTWGMYSWIERGGKKRSAQGSLERVEPVWELGKDHGNHVGDRDDPSPHDSR